jgi:hypothetical protein
MASMTAQERRAKRSIARRATRRAIRKATRQRDKARQEAGEQGPFEETKASHEALMGEAMKLMPTEVRRLTEMALRAKAQSRGVRA